MLRRNVGQYPQITPIRAALWNEDETVNVSAPACDSGARGEWAFTTGNRRGESVRSATVPTLVREQGLGSVDILKIDIKGAEKEVFFSSDWIDSVRCLMIETRDRFKRGCSEAVAKKTGDFSYCVRGEISLYIQK